MNSHVNVLARMFNERQTLVLVTEERVEALKSAMADCPSQHQKCIQVMISLAEQGSARWAITAEMSAAIYAANQALISPTGEAERTLAAVRAGAAHDKVGDRDWVKSVIRLLEKVVRSK